MSRKTRDYVVLLMSLLAAEVAARPQSGSTVTATELREVQLVIAARNPSGDARSNAESHDSIGT
jgi:hypothetical protein